MFETVKCVVLGIVLNWNDAVIEWSKGILMVIQKLYFQDKVNVSLTIVLLFRNYIFTISMVYSTLYCGQQGHHFLYKIAVESSLCPDGRVRGDWIYSARKWFIKSSDPV